MGVGKGFSVRFADEVTGTVFLCELDCTRLRAGMFICVLEL